MEDEKLVPSPFLGLSAPIQIEPTKEDIKNICEKYSADSGILILFRKEDFKCNKTNCEGMHTAGEDYNISHIEAHISIEIIKNVFGLNDCEHN